MVRILEYSNRGQWNTLESVGEVEVEMLGRKCCIGCYSMWPGKWRNVRLVRVCENEGRTNLRSWTRAVRPTRNTRLLSLSRAIICCRCGIIRGSPRSNFEVQKMQNRSFVAKGSKACSMP
jgi:hypothetical protein